MLGLATITLVLGIRCWLIRERDDRLTKPDKTGSDAVIGLRLGI
jgi:hypothetical protein